MRALLGVLLPFGAMLIVLRRTRARDCGLGVCLSAACAFGLGVSSLGWWALLHVPGPTTAALAAVDIATWTALVGGVWLGRRASGNSGGVDGVQHEPGRWREPAMLVALSMFGLLAALAILHFAATTAIVPHGGWDAWAIWNARARFLSLGFPTWHEGFLPPAAHHDYPLLLPLSVARLWALAGDEGVWAPIVLATLFGTGLVVLAGGSIWRERGPARGLLASAFILASPALARWAPAQEADVPLSLYMLLTLVLMTAAARHPDAVALWAFSGLAAGLAAWTKNEGLAFAIVIVLVAAYYAGRSGGRRARLASLSALMAGAAPVLFVVVSFKFTVAWHSDLAAGQSVGRILRNITDQNRIALVIESITREIWFGGAVLIGILPLLAVFVASSGVSRRNMSEVRPALVTLAVMLAIYMMVYVLTPHPVQWHLTYSIDRLILHLTPSIVWVAFMLIGPSEPASTALLRQGPPPVGPAAPTSIA